MIEPKRIGVQGWQQFQENKSEILGRFYVSKKQADAHIVKTSHGNVGEAEFRAWLQKYLPKKFGVTSGYVVPSGTKENYKLPHFDVIIYDQIESPILWIEENSDKSYEGKSKAIPIQYCHAIIEIKSNFTEASVKNAVHKIKQINDYYISHKLDKSAKIFPSQLFVSMVFYELESKNENMAKLLNYFIPSNKFPPNYYGAIILKAESLSIKDTGKIGFVDVHKHFQKKIQASKPNGSLISGCSMSKAIQSKTGQIAQAYLDWMEPNFSLFANDLLAHLQNLYEPGKLLGTYGMSYLKTDSLGEEPNGKKKLVREEKSKTSPPPKKISR